MPLNAPPPADSSGCPTEDSATVTYAGTVDDVAGYRIVGRLTAVGAADLPSGPAGAEPITVEVVVVGAPPQSTGRRTPLVIAAAVTPSPDPTPPPTDPSPNPPSHDI